MSKNKADYRRTCIGLSMNEKRDPALLDALADDRREWVEALDALQYEFGEAGVREMLRAL